jgi:peptidoglycan/xylan/chitin deacetylase (PgdA/CDA1 family)
MPSNLPTATGKGPSGTMLVTGDRSVALTFDDGPDPTYTPKILDLLQKYGVKATFCVVGFRARDHPELIQRIYNEGHTLCNHSWQHLFTLGTESDAAILKDLQATNAAIHKAVPDAPIAYFRAPGGNYNTRLVGLASSLGMKSLYWAVDPRDWEFTKYGHGTSMVNHVVSSIESSTRPGSIILSHDLAKPDTIAAYAILLPWLKARFTLIALPTSTAAPSPSPTPSNTYGGTSGPPTV